jgi:hypothetical protein
MKTEYRIYAALAVAAALGGAYYVTQKDAKIEQEARATSASKQDLPTAGLEKDAIEKITKIEITNADKGKVVLEKKGDAWELVEPIQAKANQADVKSLLDGFEDLKVTEAIDRGTAQYDAYDLGEKDAVHVVAHAGGEEKLDLWFGKSGSRGQMMRIDGTDGVYAATGYQSWLFTKEAKNWRDKSILKFDDKAASKVVVENEHGRYTFEKKGDAWTGSLEPRNKKGTLGAAKAWEKFEPKKVDDLLRAYKSLNAVDFAAKDEETGLADPLKEGGTVTITAGDATYTLKVGKTQKGSNRFAVKEGGDGTVVVVSSWAADWAVAEPSKFEKKDDKKKDDAEKDDAEGGDDLDLDLPAMPDLQ